MLEGLVKALGAKRVGTYYMALCPAHKDKNPSLSITEKAGKVLVKCHAGCEQRDVIAALRERGLWQPEPKESQGRIVAEYSYTDASGALLYQVVRLEPKSFFQRYPDGCGGWIKRKYSNQVLYRLREVRESPIVFCVEGEKDVECLRSHGFVATTTAGGSVAPWLDSYTASLAGREVIIIPDNDPPGWKRAKEIAKALLGHAARIIVLDDIHRHGCKDISDWFCAGHSECELIAMLEGVHAV